MMILAIDVGGTTIKIGLLKHKQIIKRWVMPTTHPLTEKISFFLTDKVKWSQITAVGVSFPGYINHDTGFVRLSPNLNIKNWNAKVAFEKAFKKPTFVINDANAAAFGEYWVGSGSQYKSVVFYIIGTGVGGGLIIDDKLVYGKSGYAGEFGHSGKFQNEMPCTCGLKYCLEPVSSAKGIERHLTAHFKKLTTIKDVATLLRNGDPAVSQIFKTALEPLVVHISIIMSAVNPEVILLGGGPSALGEPLLVIVRKILSELQNPFMLSDTQIALATTGNDAGLYGAALWALRKGK